MIDPLSPENPKLSEENMKREAETLTPEQLSERCAFKNPNNVNTVEEFDKELDDIVAHYHKIIVNPKSLGLEIVFAANALRHTQQAISTIIHMCNIYALMSGKKQIATIANRFEIKHAEWCRTNGTESYWFKEQTRAE